MVVCSDVLAQIEVFPSNLSHASDNAVRECVKIMISDILAHLFLVILNSTKKVVIWTHLKESRCKRSERNSIFINTERRRILWISRLRQSISV